MPKPVLYTPLRVEQVALRGAARSMRLVHTGMGPRRAAAAALKVALIDRAPVLVAGVGGGLMPRVQAGDVVVASEVWGDGPGGTAVRHCVGVSSAPLLADALRRLGLSVHLGPIVSSSRILRGTARSRVAAEADGALAVDMESAALITAGVPFAVVRVIVDSVDYPLWCVGTPLRGVRALRVLRTCLPALEWWAAAIAATASTQPDPRATHRLPGQPCC